MNQEQRTKNHLTLAYFGTPDFSAIFLEKLLQDSEIPVSVKLVVTQPDAKTGRRQIMQATPVKEMALRHNLQIAILSHGHIVEENNVTMEQFNNVDLALVYAFGEIIPAELLTIPHYGFWNVHPSLLPKYRGASPMATPLINGDQETGVTLIKMDEEIDHGPIIAHERVKIEPTDMRPDLEQKLTDLGYEMFKTQIDNLIAGTVSLTHQDHSEATFTQRLTKDDGFIKSSQFAVHSSRTAREIYNRFRGLYPWPGTWTIIKSNIKNQRSKIGEKRLKITDLEVKNQRLVIKKVQLEGKKEVDFATFKRAYPEALPTVL